MIGGGLPEGIVAEESVVVEVFVAGGESEEALGQECGLGMDDAFGRAGIGDGAVEGRDQADLPVGFAEEQESGIGGDRPGGKLGRKIVALDTGKRDRGCGTVCHRGGCR